MTPAEVGLLLSLAASYDEREVGDAQVVAWFAAIQDLDFGDAEAAVVAHYQESRFKVMPADVRQRVKAMRRDRLDRVVIEAPPHDLSPGQHKAELARRVKEIASGMSIDRALADGDRPRAIEGGKP